VAWIRLSDDYIDDEKMIALSHGAFRLWHEGLAYCRRKKTDGLIPFVAMRGFRYYARDREKELTRSAREGIAPLWRLIPAMGYMVNNYLDWNLSKEEEENEKAGAAARMRKFRTKGFGDGVTNGVTNAVTPAVTNAFVPDGIGERSLTERESERKPAPDARSKRPIFAGQRLVVFEWMLDDLTRMLGSHVEEFDLHDWFYALDAKAVQSGQVIPQRDGGKWLLAQTQAEAARRGLPIATAEPARDYVADTHAAAERLRELLRRDGTIA